MRLPVKAIKPTISSVVTEFPEDIHYYITLDMVFKTNRTRVELTQKLTELGTVSTDTNSGLDTFQVIKGSGNLLQKNGSMIRGTPVRVSTKILSGAKSKEQVRKLLSIVSDLEPQFTAPCAFNVNVDISSLSEDELRRMVALYMWCENIVTFMHPLSRAGGYSLRRLLTKRFKSARYMNISTFLRNDRNSNICVNHKTPGLLCTFRAASPTTSIRKAWSWICFVLALVNRSKRGISSKVKRKQHIPLKVMERSPELFWKELGLKDPVENIHLKTAKEYLSKRIKHFTTEAAKKVKELHDEPVEKPVRGWGYSDTILVPPSPSIQITVSSNAWGY